MVTANLVGITYRIANIDFVFLYKNYLVTVNIYWFTGGRFPEHVDFFVVFFAWWLQSGFQLVNCIMY